MNPELKEPRENPNGQYKTALSASSGSNHGSDENLRESAYKDGVSRKNVTTQHNVKSSVAVTDAKLTTATQGADQLARSTTISGRNNDERNQGSNEDQDDDAERASNEEPDARYNQLKREKRLAMNRASAKERRKRKAALIKHLQQKVLELSGQVSDLQESNETLKMYATRVSSDLTQAQATIRLLVATKAPRAGAQLLIEPPPRPTHHLAGANAEEASTIKHGELIQALLARAQSQDITNTAPGVAALDPSVLPPQLPHAAESVLLSSIPAAGSLPITGPSLNRQAAITAALAGDGRNGIRSPHRQTTERTNPLVMEEFFGRRTDHRSTDPAAFLGRR